VQLGEAHFVGRDASEFEHLGVVEGTHGVGRSRNVCEGIHRMAHRCREIASDADGHAVHDIEHTFDH